MAIKLGIAEILARVSTEPKTDRKIEILRENESPVLLHILALAFTKGVEWLLPDGDVPFTPSDIPGQQGILYTEWRRFYLFFPGSTIAQNKREDLFIQILENLDPDDARLIVAIKDGKMPYKTVTKNLVTKAFPNLFPTDADSTD